MPFLDIFVALCGIGVLESMLAQHLNTLGAGTVEIGSIFLLFGCCYMLGNVLFGWVSYDKRGHSQTILNPLATPKNNFKRIQLFIAI